MVIKRKLLTPQEYISVGMAFFLIGLLMNLLADGRLITAFFANFISAPYTFNTIQGMSAGLSIPILCASIFFNIRGLCMLRNK
jgi:hypothetical protein